MRAANEAGDFARALQLHNIVQGLGGVRQEALKWRAGGFLSSSIGGHLRRPCSAGDAAAVAQLQRLVCFVSNAFVDLKKRTLQTPLLLPAILADSRAVQ
ncbi:hypothetical protein OEZ86_013020 [Tetradesmus obliquus]|nr:hypothetical protein OEZ86_013020 [Tetradesmus obliquus]